MLDISFEINGRKVKPNNVGDALENAVVSSVAESIKKSVGSIRCKEHNQSPIIKVKGRSLDSLSFEVSGCCEALTQEITEKLK